MAEKAFDPVSNLIPMSERSKDEVRAIAAIGGRNSGETRRKRKALREIYDALLALPATPAMLESIADVAQSTAEAIGQPLTAYDVIALAQIVKAAKGDTAAAQYIRDSAGDKPTDKQEVTATVLTDADKALLERVAKRLGTE